MSGLHRDGHAGAFPINRRRKGIPSETAVKPGTTYGAFSLAAESSV